MRNSMRLIFLLVLFLLTSCADKNEGIDICPECNGSGNITYESFYLKKVSWNSGKGSEVFDRHDTYANFLKEHRPKKYVEPFDGTRPCPVCGGDGQSRWVQLPAVSVEPYTFKKDYP